MALTKPDGSMLNIDAAGSLSELSDGYRVTGQKVVRSQVATDIDMPYALTEISGFRKNIQIEYTGLVFLTWSVDMSHRAISAGSPTYDPPFAAGGSGGMPLGTYYPIGISGQVAFRRAVLEANLGAASWSYLGDTIGAGQLPDRKAHYETIGMARFPFLVDGGYWYQFSLALSSHTDAGTMNGVDGAAELTTGGGINFLQIEYEPGRDNVA